MPGLELLYRIDAQDRLCHVNDAWRAFASANDGGVLAGEAVLGRSLWGFVSDPSVVQAYRRIVAAARGGKATRLRFRCDAPAERRLLEMTVTGASDGAVQFHTRPHALAARPKELLLDALGRRSGTPVHVCSWCNRIRAADAWVEVEVAVERLHLMLRSVLPPVVHGACEPCLRGIGLALDRYFHAPRAEAPGAAVPLLVSLGDDPMLLEAA